MNNSNDYMLLLQAFGSRIRGLRKQKGLTQEELAGIAGLNRSYYSDIETGKRNITFLGIYKLAIALDVEMHQLMDFKDEYLHITYQESVNNQEKQPDTVKQHC